MSTRAVQGAALSLSAVLVLLDMSATDQGFYFAFISFGILLQLCDFGLSYASLQAASHLLATGRSDELGGLAHRALRINAVSTSVATIVVTGLGTWTFASAHAATTSWIAPWLWFVAGVALNHLTAPSTFLVEGGLSVTRAWQLRLMQEVMAGVALLVVLGAGFGLWSLVAYYWVRTVVAAWWLRRYAPIVFGGERPAWSRARWMRELWPFQWRVGIGAISNFLVFQAFGPILFALRGPDQAGRFSLSLAVMNAIVMVTTAWPVSQAAHYGVMLGRSDTTGMRTHWIRLVIGSTFFATTSAIVVIGVLSWLPNWQPDLMSRFAGPLTTALLVASAVAHHVIACFAVVLRAERRDPLMMLGIVGGVVTVTAMTMGAAFEGLRYVALAYLVATVATAMLAYRIYRSFERRRLHAPTPTPPSDA